MNKIKAFWKLFLSYFKTNWKIEDYPLRCKILKNVVADNKYYIQVINWWTLSGLGSTKEEALKSLRRNFEIQIKSKAYIPRPGTNVPIQFASSQKIDNNKDITDDFIEKILGFSTEDPVFISDESSLYDFSEDGNLQTYSKKIQKIYGIDISNIKDGKISKIIEKIASKSK
jgi:hypothetical protein